MARRLRALVPPAVVAALLLSAGRASAEEDRGVRLRYGGSLGGGMFIVPGFTTLAAVGLHLQIGVQMSRTLRASPGAERARREQERREGGEGEVEHAASAHGGGGAYTMRLIGRPAFGPPG